MHKHEVDECGVCKIPSFERNNYFHGKTLSARDLSAEQRYFNEKRWLINRMVIGWGVVCGLEVALEGDCLIVTPGLALDCCGHEVLVCDRQMVHIQSVTEQMAGDTAYGAAHELRWMLCLEHRESRVESVALPSTCDQSERGREHNRIRDEYRLRVRLTVDRCPEDQSVDCCPPASVRRSIPMQKAVVERSRKCPGCSDCDCLVLATGWLKRAPQQTPRIELEDDYWRYRRTVHTNPALADMIRCLHAGLAHISGINWPPGAHYRVDAFVHGLREGLKVTFDREMDEASVANLRSCRLSLATVAEGQGCPVQSIVPVRRIEYADKTATYFFDAHCAEYELRRTCQKHQKPADVELVLHGSMIHDTAGRALDAELIREFPTGNSVEGGEFIACYTVEP